MQVPFSAQLRLLLLVLLHLAGSSPCDEFQGGDDVCSCQEPEWAFFTERIRTAMGLGPIAKYAGDFSEMTDKDWKDLGSLCSQLMLFETEAAGGQRLDVDKLRNGESICPPGLASVLLIQFIFVVLYSMEAQWPDINVLTAASMTPLTLYKGCVESPAWIFNLEDAARNLLVYEIRRPFIWRRFALERARARNAGRRKEERRIGKESCSLEIGGVDVCCNNDDFNEFATKLAVFANPAYSRLTPPAHFMRLMPAVQHFDYCSWSFVVPALADCKSGYAVLTLLAWIHDRMKAVVTKSDVERAVVPLLTSLPLQDWVTSRFPIFWLLAHAFESDNVPAFPSKSCRSDLALHLHSVLDGASSLDPALVDKVIGEATTKSMRDGGVCAQQMAVTLAAVGRQSLPPDMDRLLVGDTSRALEWLKPTPWPVWSALHTLWSRMPAQPTGRNPLPLSLGTLSLPSSGEPDYDSVAMGWQRMDFNGWGLPGTVLGERTAAESQDDGWTAVLDEVLEKRVREQKDTPQPRVAFLESQLPSVFDDSMNFDYRPQDEREKSMLVPYEVFKQEWRQFLASPETAVSRHGKVVGHFDKSTLGLIHAWEADFLAWPTEPNQLDLARLRLYDVLIVMDEYPKGRAPNLPVVQGQVRIWQPWEPLSFRGSFTRTMPLEYCPVVMDLFNMAKPPAVLMHHYYLVSDWQRALAPQADEQQAFSAKPEAFVFYSNPTHVAELEDAMKQIGFRVTRAPEGATMKDYWQVLQRAAVAVLPPLRAMSRPSCGQAIADAAMARCVPTFSPRTKLFARIIMPAFLSYRSQGELLAKLKLLHDNLDWRDLLSAEVCRRLRYIDADYAETPLQFMERVAQQIPGDSRCRLPSTFAVR